MKKDYNKISILKAALSPVEGGVYKLYANYYWPVTADNCILVYKSGAPQCNSDELIARSLANNSPFDTTVIRLPAVWLPWKEDA